MRTVTVPALHDFAYKGQTYRKGDTVALEPLDAAMVARSGHISLSRGQYLRSDLTAAAPSIAVDTPAPSSRRGRRRRHVAESDQDRDA